MITEELVKQAKAVDLAISQYRLKNDVTAICPVCSLTLKVWIDWKVGAARVWCDTGCTQSNTRFQPQS